MSAFLRRVHRPCAECPWRRDTEPGQFPACRYDALRSTARQEFGAPMFACHKSPEGAERACAGWLVVVGPNHITVRLALATGRLDSSALTPSADWPPLFDGYEEMAAAQGASS